MKAYITLLASLYVFGLAVRANEFLTAKAEVEYLSKRALVNSLAQLAKEPATDGSNEEQCTLDKLRFRRDWKTFSTEEKKEYINAVLCIQSKPGLTPPELAPGVRSRFDDFVANHINLTYFIHFTGTFLGWHRRYIWAFEETLREECGYTGALPYWNWPDSYDDLTKDPIFDGSDTSLSGNGEYIPNKGDIVLHVDNPPAIILPPGSGGGCVTSGPFKDYQVNLGPGSLSLPGNKTDSRENPLDYNPRCLKRDLTTEVIRMFANYSSVAHLISKNDHIWNFQTEMQGPQGSTSLGVHGGGHYAIGGDPGRDFMVSPGDPAFYLHHSMIDRVWWIWQNQDPENRETAISGTNTLHNNPPSENTTLDTLVDLGYAWGKPVPMRDIMSTVKGSLCYVYL